MSTVYRVVTDTGTASGAGTDADVYLTLYGDRTVGREQELDNGDDNFENGASDTFRVEDDDLGNLVALRIRHNNQGDRAGWFLDRVVVTRENPPTTQWVFPCGRWLARDEDDGSTDRLLFPTPAP
jgi:hypothetical protein